MHWSVTMQKLRSWSRRKVAFCSSGSKKDSNEGLLHQMSSLGTALAEAHFLGRMLVLPDAWCIPGKHMYTHDAFMHILGAFRRRRQRARRARASAGLGGGGREVRRVQVRGPCSSSTLLGARARRCRGGRPRCA